MTNAEKYKDAIMAQMCKTGDWAANKSGEITPCACEKCADCEFNINSMWCVELKQEWLNAEAVGKKVFSEKDKEVLRALDKVKWVARDKDGSLCAYVKKPFKDIAGYWYSATYPFMGIIDNFSTAEFASVKWEDDEPTSREEILGEEE